MCWLSKALPHNRALPRACGARATRRPRGRATSTVRSYPSYGMPLFWRVFLTNAALLLAAAVALVVTPATVSFPVALAELGVLGAGLSAVIALNLVLLRRVFQPLRALSALMRGVDPLNPGARAR